MKNSVETYTLSEEMRRKAEALTDSSKQSFRRFTEEEDTIILEFHNKKNKVELSELLGICTATLRNRYKELEEQK